MNTYLCPVCHKPLIEDEHSARCQGGHVFDKAKEGYYYLITQKSSKDPGDNKEMICARRDFLDGGYYAPLANLLSETINKLYPQSITLLDAGTGTGFYLGKIMHAREGRDDEYFAIDVSKHAVKIASKRNNGAHCAVASVFDIPLKDKSVDVVLCVFSPYAMEQYARVLKDDGILIVAYPCEKHLLELRSALYENVREVATTLPLGGFEVAQEKELTYTFQLSNDDICNLLTMTPYVYRAPKDKIEALKNKSEAIFTADFHVSVLKKHIR